MARLSYKHHHTMDGRDDKDQLVAGFDACADRIIRDIDLIIEKILGIQEGGDG